MDTAESLLDYMAELWPKWAYTDAIGQMWKEWLATVNLDHCREAIQAAKRASGYNDPRFKDVQAELSKFPSNRPQEQGHGGIAGGADVYIQCTDGKHAGVWYQMLFRSDRELPPRGRILDLAEQCRSLEQDALGGTWTIVQGISREQMLRNSFAIREIKVHPVLVKAREKWNERHKQLKAFKETKT